MTDPIADMLTRIRNACLVQQEEVLVPHSNLKAEIAKTLKSENYIIDYQVTTKDQPQIEIKLKYINKTPVISKIDRVSKPGRRVYLKSKDIKPQLSGYGILILSTNQGVMTGKTARQKNLGGEVICKIY